MRYPGLSFLLIILCFFQTSSKAQDSTLSKPLSKPHMFGIIYDVAFFPDTEAGLAHLTSLEYTNKNKTNFTVRVNIADRFGTTGMQLEGDAYPVISKKSYAYLNAGVADDKLFPRYRGGSSLFHTLPAAFEAEGGFRFLYFNSPIWIYTASLGKYYKSYWFNASAFVTRSEGLPLQSYYFKTRYYFNERSFMMLTLGTGISPDDKRNNNQFAETVELRTRRAELSFKLYIKRFNVISFGAGFLKQHNQEKASSTQLNTSIGYYKIF